MENHRRQLKWMMAEFFTGYRDPPSQHGTSQGDSGEGRRISDYIYNQETPSSVYYDAQTTETVQEQEGHIRLDIGVVQ